MARAWNKALLPAIFLFLTACGGGKGGGTPSAPTSTTVSGKVFAASMAGAVITVKSASGASIAGPVTAGTDGSYGVSIPDTALAGDLVFESSGGTFTDEATGATGVAGGILSAYAAGGALVASPKAYLTPQSTILRNLVPQAGSVTAAQNLFNAAFGYTPDISLNPVEVTLAPPGGTTDAQKLEGLRAAAFSQLTADLGLAPAKQFDVVRALSDDLSDGALDGMKSSVPATTAGGTTIPADVANRHEAALIASHTSHWNKFGLMADKIGFLPFAKTALSATYRIEYIPGTSSAMEGKTAFQLKISKKSDGSPATGIAVSLLPRMVMSGQYGHYSAVPPDGVAESATPGTYNATVFYVMAGEMGSGQSLGYWQLKVTAGGESVFFFPRIAPSGADTDKAGLRSNSDLFNNEGIVTSRLYYLWKDTLSLSGGSSSFGIFISAADGYFQPIFPGATLSDQNGTSWTVNSLSMRASTDGVTWSNMACNSNGRCSISGLTGLAKGVPGKIYVKMSINGVDYTTNGLAPGGSNAYATFNVTP